jgi:aarF domain-containing kinase
MIDAHIDSVLTVGEPFAQNNEYDFGKQEMTKKTYELMPVMVKHRIQPPP